MVYWRSLAREEREEDAEGGETEEGWTAEGGVNRVVKPDLAACEAAPFVTLCREDLGGRLSLRRSWPREAAARGPLELSTVVVAGRPYNE